jgi:hypothetical protein
MITVYPFFCNHIKSSDSGVLTFPCPVVVIAWLLCCLFSTHKKLKIAWMLQASNPLTCSYFNDDYFNRH